MTVVGVGVGVGFGAKPAAAAWTPNDVASLIAWYDMTDDANMTAVGDEITQIDDLGPNGYHVSQSLGSKNPTRGLRTIGGYNALDFDGTDTLNKTSGVAIPIYGSNDIYVIMVLEPDVASEKYVFYMNGSSVATWFSTRGVYSTFGGLSTSITMTTDEQILRSYVTDSFAEVWRNSVSLDTDAHTNTTERSLTAIYLGATSFQFIGGICEIAVCRTQADAEEIETEWLAKYSSEIP